MLFDLSLDTNNVDTNNTNDSMTVDSVTYNDCKLFRIKRNSNETLLLQKNVGVIFFSKPSTFNSMCWNIGVEQKPASSEELSTLRKLNAVEKGTRKANLLPIESITKVLEHSKKNEILETLKLLITAPADSSHVGVSYVTKFTNVAAKTNSLDTSSTLLDGNNLPSPQTPPSAPPTDLTPASTTTPPIKPVNLSPIPYNINETSPIIAQNHPLIQSSCDKSMVINSATIKKKKYALSESEFSTLLQHQLLELQSFWMGTNNLLRQAPAVNIVTHSKRKERTLCYLGWLKSERHVNTPNLNHFDVANTEENRQHFEDYITYLKDIRKLSSGTIVGKHMFFFMLLSTDFSLLKITSLQVYTALNGFTAESLALVLRTSSLFNS